MTHAEFLVYLRQTYAGLFDPSTSEEAWSLFLTANTGWNELIEEYVRRVEVFLAKHGLLSKLYIRQIEENGVAFAAISVRRMAIGRQQK